MSLLDDVSIVITPNGYKAGELYAVVPVPIEGAEKVTNGDFSADSNWNQVGSNGWSIDTITSTLNFSSASSYVFQGISTVTGLTYKVTLDIELDSGTIVAKSFSAQDILTVTSTGRQTLIGYFKEGDSNSNFGFVASGSASGKIHSISVKEYTAADMDVTRATAATRVDENGLVNYAEILGSEEVTNGDYTEAGVGNVISQSGGVLVNDSNRLKITSDGSSGFSRGVWETNGSQGDSYIIKADVISTSGTVRFIDVSNNASSTDLVAGSTYERIVTLGSSGKQVGFGGLSDTSFEIILDNVSVKEVTRDNVPRIDYTGGGCPHILAEPQRTNLVTYSEDFSQWTLSDITLGSDGVSPSGQTNANLIQTGTAGSDQVSKIFTLSATNTTTYSVFIKRVSGAEWIDFLIVKSGFSNSLKVWFNINTGSVGSNNQTGTTTLDNASIESFGNNWYKLNVTTTDTTNNTSFNIRVRTASADGSDTRVNNSSYYLWGMQLEEGSYATSYIPTSGSTVTRNQDIFTRDGVGSLINSTEGVLFAEIAALATINNAADAISIGDGTTANQVAMWYSNSTNQFKVLIRQSGNKLFSTLTLTDAKAFIKVAISYKSGDMKVYINGVSVATSVSPFAFTEPLTLLDLGATGLGTFNGKVKQLQVYKTALTDDQLRQITQ